MNKKSLNNELDITAIEKAIGYHFNNKNLLLDAITHSSYANEMNLSSYERLEFLGDSVLGLCISILLYTKYPHLSEGEMTKIRATLVCEASLCDYSNTMHMGKFLRLGKGEDLSGGRKRASILADVFEAVLGGIYLDAGLEAAQNFVFEKTEAFINKAVHGKLFMDYKTGLQEKLQVKGERKIEYRTIEEKGPEHDREFVVQVMVDEQPVATGTGKSKKEAEQEAARKALEQQES